MGGIKFIVATLLVLALAAGAASYTYQQSAGSREIAFATLLPAAQALPQFALLDQNGMATGPQIFEGRWNLVFFGFTHCPDICPTTLQVLADAQQQLQASGQEPLPRIVLISVDPERDTPEALAQYIGYFGADNMALTGELNEIRKLTESLGVYFEKRRTGGDDGNYSVDHTSVVLLIDPDAQYTGIFTSPHKAGNFVADLPLIMAAE